MNFNCGDHVVHPSFGVGTVIKTEEMKLSGERPRLFYRVDFVKTTVWVPVQIQKAGGLRLLTPKKDLPRYRDVLKSQPTLLDDQFRQRQNELENRLELGTFQSLCEVVRDLSARNREKSLNSYEKSLLRQSWEALVQEWAASSELSPLEAKGEIDGCLLKGRQNS